MGLTFASSHGWRPVFHPQNYINLVLWHTPINSALWKIRNSKSTTFPDSSHYLKYDKAHDKNGMYFTR